MVDDVVASNGETDSFLDGFVRAVFCAKSGIGGCFVGRDFRVVDEEEGVGTTVGVGIVALGTLSKFIAEACFPLCTL